MGATVQPRRPLYIVGAGDFGREIESMLEMIPPHLREWDIAGYVDDNGGALDGLETGYQVVGNIDGFGFPPESVAILAISEPGTRETVYGKLKTRVRFTAFIHPTAIVFKYVQIAEGVIVGANCVLSNSVNIGRFVILNQGTQIGHDSVIGDFAALMSNVDLGGHCQIGARAFVATGATLIPGIRVGPDARIGAGSVVIRNVKERITVFGVPAKLVSGA